MSEGIGEKLRKVARICGAALAAGSLILATTGCPKTGDAKKPDAKEKPEPKKEAPNPEPPPAT